MTESSSSKPFGTEVPGTATVAVASGTSWVSVAELLEHQVTVQSSEAVAVVAELCAVLLARGTDVIPHAADVLVNDEGQLAIRNWDSGDSDSVTLGRLLHNLFATAPTPARLRLFVSHAISSERYQSVSAFAEALAAYEVPGRNQLIQAVHHRWVATRAAQLSSVRVPALPEPEQDRKSAQANAGDRRISRLAIATVSVGVVFGGATGAWFAAGAKPLPIPSISLSVPAAIKHALAWLDASIPSDTTAAVPETRTPQRSRAAKPSTATAGVRTSNPVLDPATATGVTDPTLASESVDAPVTTDSWDGVTSTTRVVSDTPTPGQLNEVATVADATVYSRAFPDVKPPVMMPRQITPPDALTPGVETASTLELLVDESGGVERVRLLSRPSPVLATMLLSAAKTWKFKPALNDGRPVKYRLLLDVMTTQR